MEHVPCVWNYVRFSEYKNEQLLPRVEQSVNKMQNYNLVLEYI